LRRLPFRHQVPLPYQHNIPPVLPSIIDLHYRPPIPYPGCYRLCLTPKEEEVVPVSLFFRSPSPSTIQYNNRKELCDIIISNMEQVALAGRSLGKVEAVICEYWHQCYPRGFNGTDGLGWESEAHSKSLEDF